MPLPFRWLALCVVAAVRALAQLPELLWETGGFSAPESVVFDAGRNQFYVSNMGAYGRGATPGDGFISRVGPDGKMLELKWVAGLQDPKGLALANGRLYVGDNADLVEIDPATGAITARHQPEDGPGSFNDCTADEAGNVYVFSNRRGTVFRLAGGKFEPWLKVDRTQSGGLNGLKAEKHRLLLGGWTVRGADGKERPGHLSFVTFGDTPQQGRIGRSAIGRIDGIEPDGRDGYTVTDWWTGDLLHVTAAGEPAVLLSLGRGTADHTYLLPQRFLVVPHVLDHKVRAYRWTAGR
ncbi:MAG: hypothetical protein QG602_3931 [Verrucomicrobiota bacterium]|nr:hypothetical protein [Verrucomicrobiota bacterium]